MTLHYELITPNLRTTSRVVAEKFGKRHADVLRIIERIIGDAPAVFTERNFALSDYMDSTGRSLPQYELTRDGFMLLTMGFTGQAAMAWKVRFIEAFNLMEAELLRQAVAVEPPRAAPETHLFDDVPLREAMVKLSTLRETRLLWGRDAARRVWAMLGMPDVASPGGSSRGSDADEPSLEAFLSDCFEITGNPRDRVYPPEMWQRYQDWAASVCAPPIGHRTFSLRLSALVANWRCPRTGRRISRMKSGTTLYSGLRPMVVTP